MVETGETLVDVLRRRAEREGDRVALVHLEDGEAREAALNYRELDRRARVLAAYLAGIGAAGERALLLHPHGPDYLAAFFGCLYAGVVAVPLFPPDDARPSPRLRAITRDAGAVLALTTASVLAGLRSSRSAAELAGLRLVATDELDAGAADAWRPSRGPSADALAFLQYTSGSTAAPKGVMIRHANLVHNERELQRCWGHDERSVLVSWLPLFHDMGLVGAALQAVFAGAKCILMSPEQFLQRPARWLQAITRHRATTSGGPNFAYDVCAAKVTEAEKAALDLSSWTVAFDGAEPVRHATLERFHAAFAACGFRREAMMPGYGLAESTLVVSAGKRTEPPVALAVRPSALEAHRVVAAEAPGDDVRVLVGCGRAVAGAEIAIVDPERRVRVAPDEVGEIWVASPSVAAGYWRRDEESEATFRATIAGDDGRRFLRTGDLGFLRAGELFVTGRLKDLILVGGRNHYPQDLEWTVEASHAALRSGGSAAFSIDRDDQERVVVAAEVERTFDVAEAPAVFDAMRHAVARRHGLRLDAAMLLERGALPKTTSGKVQRRACRAAYLAGELRAIAATDQSPEAERPYCAPRTLSERTLAALWAELLQLERVGIHDNFFELGGDSILALQIAAAARRLGLALVPRHLFELPTVAELAALVDGEDGGEPRPSRTAGPAGERTATVTPAATPARPARVTAELSEVELDPLALDRIVAAVRRGGKGARG